MIKNFLISAMVLILILGVFVLVQDYRDDAQNTNIAKIETKNSEQDNVIKDIVNFLNNATKSQAEAT